MTLLFILVILAIIFIFLFVGLPGLTLAYLYKKHTNKKVKFVAWFFAPGVLIFSFAGLFFFENLTYSIVTDSGIGLGDYVSVNLNKNYELYHIDASNWGIVTKDSLGSLYSNVQEILVQGDTIIFTKRENDSYALSQLDPSERECTVIDSASTTNILWDRYTRTRDIDRYKVYTCDKYYWRYRQFFSICALIFNIFLFIYIFRRFKGFWKRLLIEDF